MARRRKRLDPAAFALPAEGIRAGFYTDAYFQHTRRVLQCDGRSPQVLMQVSGKSGGLVAGLDEAIAILKAGCDDWSALAVHALYDGDRFDPWDTVMTIEGPYDQFGHLETVFLGSIVRRSRICTNARAVVEAARPKPVYFFGARHDHFLMQAGDGHAAHLGGAQSVSTDAGASLFGGRGMGTVPHALIAAYGGDTARAVRQMAACLDAATPIVALVDYANDVVTTSLECARALEGRLWGVRLDTSENLVDRSVVPLMGSFRPTGVNPAMVWNVRNALDAEGYGEVKIVVSGGFSPPRIRAFEEEGTPVDAYGVGASIVNAGSVDFTADIVMVDGAPESKVGRELRPNPRLERVR